MKNFIKKKKFGQNFLTDINIKKKIIHYINIKTNDIVVEIGPGLGFLSEDIKNLSKSSYFIEIDKELCNFNKTILKESIYHDDILKYNLDDIFKKHKKIRIIGNLPYNIATKIIILLFQFHKNIIDVNLIVQKEFADKIIKNNKSSRLSMSMNYFFSIKHIFNISPFCFDPKPKIISSFISGKPNKTVEKIDNYTIFNNILKMAFNYRRKKLSTSLKIYIPYIRNILDLNKRPENINIEDFIKISNIISKLEG
jgi:16S rRNA (adenine1518-N6/adenine1519-N6)-dimethyltransferase